MNSQPTSTQRRFIEAVARGLLIGVVLGAVFLAGFILRGRVPATAQEKNTGDFPLLSEVESLLKPTICVICRPTKNWNTRLSGGIWAG